MRKPPSNRGCVQDRSVSGTFTLPPMLGEPVAVGQLNRIATNSATKKMLTPLAMEP